MKVTQTEKAFRPVTIVIETEEELRNMRKVLGKANCLYDLYEAIKNIVDQLDKEQGAI